MQKLLLLCVFVILSTMMNAQDKIITTEHDTIKCRVISIGVDEVYYKQKSANGWIEKSIPISQVMFYSHKPRLSSVEHPWIFSINPGISRMPWFFENADDFGQTEKMRNGFHLNTSAHFLIRRFYGLGIQHLFFYSSDNSEYPREDNPDFPTYTMFSKKEKQYINYFGVSAIFQQFLGKNEKIQFSETISAGMFFYRDEAQFSTFLSNSSDYSTYNQNEIVTNNNFGATLGLSAEYYILPYLSMGIGGNLLIGSIKRTNTEYNNSNKWIDAFNTELTQSVKISRIDYSLVLCFHF